MRPLCELARRDPSRARELNQGPSSLSKQALGPSRSFLSGMAGVAVQEASGCPIPMSRYSV